MRMRPESLAVTQIELHWFDEPMSKATGFIYKFGQTYGLVTNWHVSSGRHPVTEVPFNQDHKVPTRVHFHISVWRREGGQVKFVPVDLPLQINGQRLWWEHDGYTAEDQSLGRVDIAVLPLNGAFEKIGIDSADVAHLSAHMIVQMDDAGQPSFVEHGYARIGSEVFILGYPLGLASQGVVPVWKRGSIASEPLMNIEGNMPIFFVDSTTRHGMSGSPILYFGGVITNEHGHISRFDTENSGPWLLGVYAGRRGSTDSEVEMLLGRGWRGPLLDEIFMRPPDDSA